MSLLLRMRRLRTRADAAAIGLFVAALAIPHWDELVRPCEARGPERYERRTGASWPGRPWSLSDFYSWSTRCEQWIADGMGFRDWILGANSAVKVFGFGIAPSDTVLLGRDGFLFFTGNHTLEIQRGLMPFRAEELDAWVDFLEWRQVWCSERGIRHLFVVAPNKETIYADHLPDWCAPLGPSRHDQLVQRLRERGSPFELLDLRPALRAARVDDRERDHLYSKLGSHWDGRGTWLAYDAVLSRLAPAFPALVPLPLGALERNTMSVNPDSWARSMYVEPLFDPHLSPADVPEAQRRRQILLSETGPDSYAESTVDDPALPRAVFMHDSFGTGIDALLGEHFSSFQTSFSPSFEPDYLEAARPDIVIELFVERIFDYWIPPPRTLPAPGAHIENPDASAERWRLPIPDPGGVLVPRGALRMIPRYDAPVALELVVSSSADTLLLPHVPPVSGARSRLHVRMVAPVETQFELWFKRTGSAEYRRKDLRSVRVRPGTNEVAIALEDAWLAEPLMLRPGRVPGRYRILSMEIQRLQ